MSGGHSPAPWRIVPAKTPYGSWIVDATGGMVACGFGQRDEGTLLAAPQLRAVCARLVAWMEAEEGKAGELDAIASAIADAARAALAGTE